MSREMLSGFRLTMAVTLLLALVTCSLGSNAKSELGRFLGFRLGLLTTARIEKILGPGVHELGGHPQSGRSWDLRNGSSLYTDGFFPRGSSLVVDHIWLTGKGLISSGFSKRLAARFGPIGKMRWGSSRAYVESQLHSLVGSNKQIRIKSMKEKATLHLPAKASGNTCEVDIDFGFKAGRLFQIEWWINSPEPKIDT